MNRSLEKVNKAKEIVSKANIVEDGPSRPPLHYKKYVYKPKGIFGIIVKRNLMHLIL